VDILTLAQTQEDVMGTPIRVLLALMANAGVSLGQPVLVQANDQTLGKVHFETSCAPEAAAAFDRGMLYQHSFWYRSSQRAFEEALKADPGCGIAYWGIALSLLWNPHAAPPPKNLVEGSVVVVKGQQVGARTERERDYLTALSAMYTDFETVDHRTRVLNYLKAMEQLAPPRRRIRAMPTSSRARRSWRRFGIVSQIILASRIT
jgi:hypothetical protein